MNDEKNNSVCEMVTITKQNHEDLLKDRKTLRLLKAGGVKNWEWYGACFDDEEE